MDDKWIKLVETVDEFIGDVTNRGSTPWFRGQADAKWGVSSSLHRYVVGLRDASLSDWSDDETVMSVLAEEKALFWKFMTDAWPLLHERERHDWGMLFTMQHFGIPTRLVDWTESFACALYFASQGWREGESAAVYLLDPEAMNEATVQRKGLIALDDKIGPGIIDLEPYHPRFLRQGRGPVETIAVAPILTNTRMLAQRAAFTIAGDSHLPLEDQVGGILVPNGVLVKLVIGPEMRANVEQFLRLIGAGEFGYFPDLDGLGRKFRERQAATMAEAVRLGAKRGGGRAAG